MSCDLFPCQQTCEAHGCDSEDIMGQVEVCVCVLRNIRGMMEAPPDLNEWQLAIYVCKVRRHPRANYSTASASKNTDSSVFYAEIETKILNTDSDPKNTDRDSDRYTANYSDLAMKKGKVECKLVEHYKSSYPL